MRKWIPATALTAIAASGVLMTNRPTPADAQTVTVKPAEGQVVTVSPIDTVFTAGGVDFEPTKGHEAVKPMQVSFPGRTVQSAEVMLKGFDVWFVDAEHPVHQQRVKLENVQISGEVVKFDARVSLRDNSGEYDDKFAGHIDYVVIARVK